MKKRMGMKTFKKVMVILGSLAAVLIAFFIFSLFWQGKPENLISDANKFQPPSSWELTSERIEPIRLICIQDIACPSLDRHWTVNEPVDLNQLAQTLQRTEWSGFTISHCSGLIDKLKDIQVKYLCSLDATTPQKNYTQFYLYRSDDKKRIEASLSFIKD